MAKKELDMHITSNEYNKLKELVKRAEETPLIYLEKSTIAKGPWNTVDMYKEQLAKKYCMPVSRWSGARLYFNKNKEFVYLGGRDR